MLPNTVELIGVPPPTPPPPRPPMLLLLLLLLFILPFPSAAPPPNESRLLSSRPRPAPSAAARCSAACLILLFLSSSSSCRSTRFTFPIRSLFFSSFSINASSCIFRSILFCTGFNASGFKYSKLSRCSLSSSSVAFNLPRITSSNLFSTRFLSATVGSSSTPFRHTANSTGFTSLSLTTLIGHVSTFPFFPPPPPPPRLLPPCSSTRYKSV
mmetsp:Transcript_15614/g.33691  ORF Transcript_15614/g.33691 Transcript_15614/m.33691 type:complete len:212 (+) Transcript_15614:461-1096(+)